MYLILFPCGLVLARPAPGNQLGAVDGQPVSVALAEHPLVGHKLPSMD